MQNAILLAIIEVISINICKIINTKSLYQLITIIYIGLYI